MSLLRSVVPVGLAAVALAGCGGGSETSESDYRAQLDAACERLQDRNVALPQKMRDEQLTLEQASELGRRYGEDFRATISSLDPPDDLGDAHERLLEIGEEPPPGGGDLAAIRRWALEIADVYGDLGADGCERAQRAVAEQIGRSAP